MKVAIIHDYLNQFGGAERVLETFLGIFPEAHVYTLLYSAKNGINAKFGQYVHKTSFLDTELVRNYHRPFIPLMPAAASMMELDNDYDLVISATAGYAKGISIRYRKDHRHGHRLPYHLSYCYTPLRYAWEIDNYFENQIFRTFFRPAFAYLKNWDYRAAQKPNKIVAISNFIAKKVKAYYGRDADVVYPPVDQEKFFYKPLRGEKNLGEYYLAVGRLLHYKKFNLTIDAFMELGLPLKVVGVGPELERLRAKTAGWWTRNIEFIPFVDDNELRQLYQGAKALIFPQVEDFGLVAAEALACGTPVIAFAEGGALEIVQDGVTGVFFHNQGVPDLIGAVRRFEKLKFNRKKISEVSSKFSVRNFKQGILSKIPKNIIAA